MTDRKKYMREYMKKNRANKKVNTVNKDAVNKLESVSKNPKIANKTANTVSKAPVSTPDAVSTIDWQDVDQSIFDCHGRGVPVDGLVLISLGATAENEPDCGVVKESTWRQRLKQTCSHNLIGWSCKACLT